MDESTSQYVYAEFAGWLAGQRRSVQRIHFQTCWVYCFGRCNRSCSCHPHELQLSSSWKDRKNTVERTIGFQRTYSIRIKWLKLLLRLPVISSQQQFVTTNAS